MERKNAWLSYKPQDEKKLEKLCDEYKDYLFRGKTEREGTKYIVEKARENGLLVITAGADVLRIVPPLIFEETDIKELQSRLDKAFKEA